MNEVDICFVCGIVELVCYGYDGCDVVVVGDEQIGFWCFVDIGEFVEWIFVEDLGFGCYVFMYLV